MTSEPSKLRWRGGDENSRSIGALSGREVNAEGGVDWSGTGRCKPIISNDDVLQNSMTKGSVHDIYWTKLYNSKAYQVTDLVQALGP